MRADMMSKADQTCHQRRAAMALLPALAVLVSACAATPPVTVDTATAASASAATVQTAAAAPAKVANDPYLPYREYSSAPIRETVGLLSGETARGSVLMGRVHKTTGVKLFGVQVVLHYREDVRRKFESAHTAGGAALKLVPVGRKRSGCSKVQETCAFSEFVDVLIPEAQLRSAPATGFSFKLFARSGDSAMITLPKPAIDGVLSGVDADPAVRAAQPAAR